MIVLKLVNNILFSTIISLSNNPPGVYFRVVSKSWLPWLPACSDAAYITRRLTTVWGKWPQGLYSWSLTPIPGHFFWGAGGGGLSKKELTVCF